MDKLVWIESSIQNALYKKKRIDCYLETLYKMRDEQLAKDGIDKADWLQRIEELKQR